MPSSPNADTANTSRPLVALIMGQLCLHSCMAGVRVAAPLLLLNSGHPAWLVGVLLGLFAAAPVLMAACAVVLGMALGSVNPMIMTALHDLTPDDRHGEAIALRSMTINSCSAVMPLVFGFAGSALGAGALFWLMGAAIGAGSSQVRYFGRG
jgi:MFS family permease